MQDEQLVALINESDSAAVKYNLIPTFPVGGLAG